MVQCPEHVLAGFKSLDLSSFVLGAAAQLTASYCICARSWTISSPFPGGGCWWRLTARDAGQPPSLYTFRRTADGSARDSPPFGGIPRILPLFLPMDLRSSFLFSDLPWHLRRHRFYYAGLQSKPPVKSRHIRWRPSFSVCSICAF